MTQPCEQEGAIGRLEATTEAIGETLKRLGTVLESIAAQGIQIETLVKGQNLLFDRVREMELTAAKEKVKVRYIMGGISAGVSVVTAFLTKKIGG